ALATPSATRPPYPKAAGEAEQPCEARAAAAAERRPPALAVRPESARGFPERFVTTRVGIGGPRCDEQEVRQPVEVGDHEGIDPIRLVGRERVALGTTACRPRDVETSGRLGPAGKDEALEHRQLGVELVAKLFESVDGGLVDG